ncbi:MAG TPA: hypothetical protein EYG11_19290 [Candidatus Latescibacteria bacterium]|nr:hypothetical protein [Candidatus Latescibacterota bacterium]
MQIGSDCLLSRAFEVGIPSSTGDQHELVFHIGSGISMGLGDRGQAFDAAYSMLNSDTDAEFRGIDKSVYRV